MCRNINCLSILDITVHHEVSHAFVAETLGMPIKYVQLSHRKRIKPSLYEVVAELHGIPMKQEQLSRRERDEDWMGDTPLDEPSSDIDPLLAVLYPVPDDEYKDVRVKCTIKFAGLVAEKLMGIDEKMMQAGCSTDIQQAEILIERSFPHEEWQKELLDAENRAMDILSEPEYWTRIENIAKGLIGALNQGREPDRSNEYLDRYEFSRDEIQMYERLE